VISNPAAAARGLDSGYSTATREKREMYP